MPFFSRGRVQLRRTMFNSFGGGGLPPVLPGIKVGQTANPSGGDFIGFGFGVGGLLPVSFLDTSQNITKLGVIDAGDFSDNGDFSNNGDFAVATFQRLVLGDNLPDVGDVLITISGITTTATFNSGTYESTDADAQAIYDLFKLNIGTTYPFTIVEANPAIVYADYDLIDDAVSGVGSSVITRQGLSLKNVSLTDGVTGIPATQAAVFPNHLLADGSSSNGLLVEKQAANYFPNSVNGDLSNWTSRGTGSIANSTQIAPDPNYTMQLISVDATSQNDVFDVEVITGSTEGEPIAAGIYIKKVTDGKIDFQHPSGGFSFGFWTIDLSLIGDGTEWITALHPAVTVVVNYVVSSSPNRVGILLRASASEPTQQFYAWGYTQEINGGFIPSSPIYAGNTAATRGADVYTLPTPFPSTDIEINLDAIPLQDEGATILNIDSDDSSYFTRLSYDDTSGVIFQHGNDTITAPQAIAYGQEFSVSAAISATELLLNGQTLTRTDNRNNAFAISGNLDGGNTLITRLQVKEYQAPPPAGTLTVGQETDSGGEVATGYALNQTSLLNTDFGSLTPREFLSTGVNIGLLGSYEFNNSADKKYIFIAAEDGVNLPNQGNIQLNIGGLTVNMVWASDLIGQFDGVYLADSQNNNINQDVEDLVSYLTSNVNNQVSFNIELAPPPQGNLVVVDASSVTGVPNDSAYFEGTAGSLSPPVIFEVAQVNFVAGSFTSFNGDPDNFTCRIAFDNAVNVDFIAKFNGQQFLFDAVNSLGTTLETKVIYNETLYNLLLVNRDIPIQFELEIAP